MIVTQLLKLDTKEIDFALAFTQSDLDVPVYMEFSAGMFLVGNGKNSSK